MADKPKEEEAAETEAAEPKKAGGIKPLLPLILTLTLMPVLAYAMTAFVLVPKLQQALGGGGQAVEDDGGHGGETDSHGNSSGSHRGQGDAPLKEQVKFSKLITNVKDTKGTKLLLTSFTVGGTTRGFNEVMEAHLDELTDVALSILGNKSIADLEKPESRNIIRSELISQFNATLGKGMVQEVYITEMAIQ